MCATAAGPDVQGRDGGANAGVLEDYADVAEGLLALHAVTGDPRHVRLAGALLDTVLERFGDGEGGFYDTADDAERLFRRPQDPTDNATPSGQFAAAGALLSFSALTGSDRHREAARAALGRPGRSRTGTRGSRGGASRSPRRPRPVRWRSP